MIGWLSRKLKGLLSSDDVRKFCDSAFDTFIINTLGKELASDFNSRYRNAFDLLKKDYFYLHIRRIFSQTTKTQQMLGLREFVLILADDWIAAEEYISEKYTDEERRILADKLYNSESKAQFAANAFFFWLVNGSMATILRVVAETHFQDATSTDYFALFLNVARQHTAELYKLTIAKACCTSSDPTSDMLTELLIKTCEEKKQEIRDTAVAGGNYDWDEESEKQQRAEEAAIQKSREPIKRERIYQGEIKQIVEILIERFERSKRGQLYSANEKVLSDPLKFFHVDTGLVWVALRECLQSEKLAEDSLREIIWQFAIQFGSASEDSSKESIELTLQEFIVARHDASKDSGWFADFLVILTKYLNDDLRDDKARTKSETDELGKLSFENGKDAWELYSKVMNIFGWEMNTVFNDQGTVETTAG